MQRLTIRLTISLTQRVVLGPAPAYESRAVDAIVALQDLAVIDDHVFRIVGKVGHVNHDHVALHVLQAGPHGTAEPSGRRAVDEANGRVRRHRARGPRPRCRRWLLSLTTMIS